MPISESRTHIHGIQESDLASVSYTLRQAQATLLKICKESTIIIGHSLHNDLKALKFDHRYVVIGNFNVI